MATGFEHFDRDLKVALADLEPEAMRRELAAFARKSLAEVISAGQAPARYDRFVNGREGAPEESVQLPGPIVYVFTNWKLVIDTAIAELRKRVPRQSGRYASSFLVVVDGATTTNFDDIPADREVIIINAQPYTRKMESGANGPGKRHFDLAKAALNRRFSGAFNVQHTFLKVGGGIDPRVPYILKGERARKRAAMLANPANHKEAIKAGKHWRRKDMEAGKPITYPALLITTA